MLRRCACVLLAVLALSGAWSKDRVTLKSLLAKSDAIYYSPAAHGVTDLAVDLVVEQFSADPVGKNAIVTFYYAGDDRQRTVVTGVPDQYAAFRNALQELLGPMAQYVIPRSASSSFAGMTLKMARQSRQLLNVPERNFFLITGAIPGEHKKGDLIEYRALVDKQGLVYQIENVYTEGRIIANVVNVKMADASTWLFTELHTRLSADLWKSEVVDYQLQGGYMLPVSCTLRFRDGFNKPVKSRQDLVIRMQNYRINQGVAAKALADMGEPEKAPAK